MINALYAGFGKTVQQTYDCLKDEADRFDTVKLFQNDHLECSARYTAKEKRNNQIQSSSRYFETGERLNLRFFENLLTPQDHYEFTTQYGRPKINKRQRQKERLSKLKQNTCPREM